jgi:hypothetical protein
MKTGNSGLIKWTQPPVDLPVSGYGEFRMSGFSGRRLEIKSGIVRKMEINTKNELKNNTELFLSGGKECPNKIFSYLRCWFFIFHISSRRIPKLT